MVRDLAVNCISQNPGAVNLFVSQHFPDLGPWPSPPPLAPGPQRRGEKLGHNKARGQVNNQSGFMKKSGI